ncbi:MAG: hypothetical protein MJ065_10310, partial [Oscillospiraceae bacterium]|nr:hypothetical protein [Oscillospiraceae bacterium]
MNSIVICWTHDLFLSQNPCNVIRTVTFNCQLEDTPDNSGSLVIDQPMVLVIRIFPITVHTKVIGRQTGFAFLAITGTHLFRLIAHIHVVQNIHEWRKLAADRIDGVHAVTDSNEADALAPEIHFRVK